MSVVSHFLDTNIFVYAFDGSAPAKAKRADALIFEAVASGKGVISYQVVQEFIAVARTRFKVPLSFDQIGKYWDTPLQTLLRVHSSPALFTQALDFAARDRLSWYDALIVAAAIQGRCKVLYSEDFQHGRRFAEVVVQNPFL
jgi:predicted nucleic acid-binding protein